MSFFQRVQESALDADAKKAAPLVATAPRRRSAQQPRRRRDPSKSAAPFSKSAAPTDDPRRSRAPRVTTQQNGPDARRRAPGRDAAVAVDEPERRGGRGRRERLLRAGRPRGPSVARFFKRAALACRPCKNQPRRSSSLRDGVDARRRHADLVERCGRGGALAKPFASLHAYYYQGQRQAWSGSDRPRRVGPPRPWTGGDVSNICRACGLEKLRERLAAEELFVETSLDDESPLTWLDAEDLEDLLGGDVAGDEAVFLLAVAYVKGSNRSASRKA